MKELYTYTVNKEEKSEVKTDNGDGTFTVSTVVKKIPVSVTVKKPSRKDREDMAMIYNAEFHKCLNNGISTEEMIRRAILDGGGGYIPQHDLEQLHVLYKELEKDRLKLQTLKIDGEDTTKIEEEINKKCQQIYDIERPQKGVFDHSAEALAARKSFIWAALMLTFIKNGDEYEFVFKGPTFASKLETYYEMCDEEKDYVFELSCFDRSYVFIERFISGMADSKEELELIEKELNRFFE